MKVGKVQRGIPLARKRHAGGRPHGDLWRAIDAMGVGDSVEITSPPEGVGARAAVIAKKIGVRVATRATAGGVRAWRVA